jgi:hypothetical protein
MSAHALVADTSSSGRLLPAINLSVVSRHFREKWLFRRFWNLFLIFFFFLGMDVMFQFWEQEPEHIVNEINVFMSTFSHCWQSDQRKITFLFVLYTVSLVLVHIRYTLCRFYYTIWKIVPWSYSQIFVFFNGYNLRLKNFLHPLHSLKHKPWCWYCC